MCFNLTEPVYATSCYEMIQNYVRPCFIATTGGNLLESSGDICVSAERKAICGGAPFDWFWDRISENADPEGHPKTSSLPYSLTHVKTYLFCSITASAKTVDNFFGDLRRVEQFVITWKRLGTLQLCVVLGAESLRRQVQMTADFLQLNCMPAMLDDLCHIMARFTPPQ